MEKMEKIKNILGAEELLDEILMAFNTDEIESFGDYIAKNHDIEGEVKWIF